MNPELLAHPMNTALNILSTMGEAGKYVWATQKAMAENKKHPYTLSERLEYVLEAIAFLKTKILENKKIAIWRELPVDFITFVRCPALLNKMVAMWPLVLREGQNMNSGRYVECVLTGAIGVAKTTLAVYTQAYQLYVLSCMINPHEAFDLDPSSEILIVFQSVTLKLAEEVGYARFRQLIDQSPYFQHKFTYNQALKSEMKFDKFNIIVKPVAGSGEGAIGQNVIGGVIDEVNFMAVTENSKKSRDGGTYDQAMETYNTIAVRRESRFMQMGTVPGMLMMVSSRNYPGQFTDIKEAEARTNPRIYIYDKRLWEIRPARYAFFTGQLPQAVIDMHGANCGFWFKVFVGDATRRPRIYDKTEEIEPRDEALVQNIPIEHKRRFQDNILKSLRDIAGVATLALHPFMVETEKIATCFGRVQSIASRNECDFKDSKIAIYPKRFRMLSEPRFVHIDLAETGDSCGVACGFISGFTSINRGDYAEVLPKIEFDFMLEVRPPRGGEIIFSKIRELLYKLRELNLPVKWVSFDQFQSTDSMQILSQQGFICGRQSMDATTTPYDVVKQALYDQRMYFPEHEKALRELMTLEYNPKDEKVDHPPNGSKDVSDGIAGVAYGLTMRRELWTKHGVPVNRIPKVLTDSENKHRKSISYKETLREARRDKAA